MSATRDKTQKFTFVYSNLYQIYKKGKDAAQSAEIPQPGLVTARVLKAENAAAVSVSPNVAPQISEYRPAELLAKRITVVQKPSILTESKNETIESLKDNLKSLNDLHSRLRMMLKELEDLVKE
jgi:hypothetical protein